MQQWQHELQQALVEVGFSAGDAQTLFDAQWHLAGSLYREGSPARQAAREVWNEGVYQALEEADMDRSDAQSVYEVNESLADQLYLAGTLPADAGQLILAGPADKADSPGMSLG